MTVKGTENPAQPFQEFKFWQDTSLEQKVDKFSAFLLVVEFQAKDLSLFRAF